MAAEGSFIHLQAVLHQHPDVERLDQAAAPGVALLHGDDFLDVLDVAAERRELLDRRIALGGQISRQLLQVLRQVFALGTRQKPRQIGGVCVQQSADLSEPGALGFLDALREETRRDIDAVEHIADVVQYVGRHLGHAGVPRGDQQLLVDLLELLVRLAALGDVLNDRDCPERLPHGTDEPPGTGESGARRAIRPDDDELGVAHFVPAQRARQGSLIGGHRRGAVCAKHVGGEGVGVTGEGGRIA